MRPRIIGTAVRLDLDEAGGQATPRGVGDDQELVKQFRRDVSSIAVVEGIKPILYSSNILR